MEEIPDVDNIVLPPPIIDETKKAICSLKNHKSPGTDGIAETTWKEYDTVNGCSAVGFHVSGTLVLSVLYTKRETHLITEAVKGLVRC